MESKPSPRNIKILKIGDGYAFLDQRNLPFNGVERENVRRIVVRLQCKIKLGKKTL